MRKIYLILLVTLLGSIAMQAQQVEYQPLVREGVRWVNTLTVVNTDPGAVTSLYNYEFRGDTVINGKVYKKCYKTLSEYPEGDLYLSDGERVYFHSSSVTPAAYLREENMKVYRYIPFSYSEDGEEVMIYDFGYLREHAEKEIIYVDGKPCYRFKDSHGDIYLESVGIVEITQQGITGTLIWPMGETIDGWYDTYYTLSHVINNDGVIIFKSPFYMDYKYNIWSFENSSVDIEDVQAAIDVMLGSSIFSTAEEADVTGDGRVDIADVSAIINHILGKDR